MKKFFNNPLVVSTIGVLALGVLGKNVVLPLFFDSGLARDGTELLGIDVGALSLDSGSNIDEKIPSNGARTDRNALYWQSAPRRDPFSASTIESASERPNRQIELDSSKAVKIDPPQFSGLVYMQNTQLVVLNGQILGVGDAINGYTVTTIGFDFVELRDKNGAHHALYSGE